MKKTYISPITETQLVDSQLMTVTGAGTAPPPMTSVGPAGGRLIYR